MHAVSAADVAVAVVVASVVVVAVVVVVVAAAAVAVVVVAVFAAAADVVAVVFVVAVVVIGSPVECPRGYPVHLQMHFIRCDPPHTHTHTHTHTHRQPHAVFGRCVSIFGSTGEWRARIRKGLTQTNISNTD